MTQEEKQFQLLERHYTNIEGFKTLRFTIPTTICSLQIGIIALLVSNIEKVNTLKIEIGVSMIIISISIFGLIALKLVQDQYLNIAKNIYHLYNQLNITGKEYYPKNNDHNTNPKQNGREIFILGYSSIILFSIIALITTIFLN